MSFALRVGSDPERFTPRLRSIATAIDASALIQEPMALDKVPDPERRILVSLAQLEPKHGHEL